jgi:hypothetical protein
MRRPVRSFWVVSLIALLLVVACAAGGLVGAPLRDPIGACSGMVGMVQDGLRAPSFRTIRWALANWHYCRDTLRFDPFTRPPLSIITPIAAPVPNPHVVPPVNTPTNCTGCVLPTATPPAP